MPRSSLNSAQRAEAEFQLRNNLLFSSLNDQAIACLLDSVHLGSLSSGDKLFSQNDVATSVFVLQSGQIKLVRLSSAGNEKVIELIAPGQSFAEALLFADIREYPVTAVALCDSQVWCIDSAEYCALLRTSYDACFAVMAALSRRSHQLVVEIDYLTLHNATVRLVAFLLNEASDGDAQNPVVELPFAKTVLASRLSIKPETLSRTFAQLSKKQLISIEERRIMLLDVERLQQLQYSN